MLPYIVTFVFIFYLNTLYRFRAINKKIFCRCAMIWIIFLTGLRSQYMGIEDVWTNYVPMFNRICNQTFTAVIEYGYRDAGFALVSKIISLFSNNYQVWLFLCSVPCIVGFCKLIEKKADDPLASFCGFFALGYFGYNTFLIRQSIALGFSILAYLAYEESKMKKAIVLISIASVFHATSLILVAIIMFKWLIKRFNWKMLALSVFAVLSVVGLTLVHSLLLRVGIARFNTYLQMMEKGKQITNSSFFFINTALFFLLLLITVLTERNIKRINNAPSPLANEFWSDCAIELERDKVLVLGIATFTGLLSMMSTIGNIYRISLYFLAYATVLIPNYIDRSMGRYRKLILLLLEVLLIAYFMFAQVNNQRINPYMFYWQ